MAKYTEDFRKSVTLNKKLLKAEVERRFTVISDPILPTPSFNALSVLGWHVELLVLEERYFTWNKRMRFLVKKKVFISSM